MTSTKPRGVLVMAYGGPASLDEIPGYLADIRSGRVTPARVLDEITENYRQIGGRSPLPEKSQAQVDALAARFDQSEVKFFLGMRHWSPWIEDRVGEMIDEGIEEAVSLVLTPHFSSHSVARYRDRIAAGEDIHHRSINWQHIDGFHDGKPLIRALAQRVLQGLSAWKEDELTDVKVLFSAHSLPERIIKGGDPYQDQLFETAALVATEAGLSKDQWDWAYQSAGRSPEPWLGPDMDEKITELSGKGVKGIISVPVGFVSDHVEILFDLDIKARELCDQLGIRLERPPALNDDPLFIDQLEQVVRRALAAFDDSGTAHG